MGYERIGASSAIVAAALCAMMRVAVLVGASLAQLVPQDDTMGAVLLVCVMAYFVYALISPLADYYRMFRETASAPEVCVAAALPTAAEKMGRVCGGSGMGHLLVI